MCTVSWVAQREGYDLFFNRDELDNRAPELPPTHAIRDGGSYVAPRDGDHGGTWLGVNQFGVTVCLLNDYASAWVPRPGQTNHSRGHIVTACMAARCHGDIVTAIQSQPLERTGPFRVLSLNPQEGALALRWGGKRLVRLEAPSSPLTSSSFATQEVVGERLRSYAAIVGAQTPSPDALARYQRQYSAAAGACSVLMRRPDAATRSLIHVAVHRDQIHLKYESIRWAERDPHIQTPILVGLRRTTDQLRPV